MRSTLETQIEKQRTAFYASPPDYRRRMEALRQLRTALMERRETLLQAVSEDFGGRAHEETLLLEIFPLLDQIRHARRHLKSWMRRRRVSSSWFLWPSRAYVQNQPLGVVGIIGAWNYPILLTLGPLIDALAAGNHVLIKPSENMPRTAQAISALIAERFAPEHVSCAMGGAEVGAAFAASPFDHLFFTGSARIGKLILRAAAENLTPVTLELGGKSPAILHEQCAFKRAVERIMAAKSANAGQTCVAPDYVLLPEGREADFEAEARRVVTRMYPCFLGNQDYTRIASEQHYTRLTELIQDAIQKGARVVCLSQAEERWETQANLIPPTLVFNMTDDMAIAQEEIFGPILPVISYRTFDEAVRYVNERPRPLALYYFDEVMHRIDMMLAKTMSGGVAVNDCIYHLGQHNLPFGGVGQSGMGHYHGFDGFMTFSKKRGIMMQRRWSATSLFQAPYKAGTRRLINMLLALTTRTLKMPGKQKTRISHRE